MLKKYPWLQHIFAVLAFLVIVMAYFSPIHFDGKKLRQDDISRWKGMAKETDDFRERTGKEPLWTNSMFGGMPTYQLSVIYASNLIRHVNKVVTLGLPDTSSFVFLYFLGFYFLLITLGVDKCGP